MFRNDETVVTTEDDNWRHFEEKKYSLKQSSQFAG